MTLTHFTALISTPFSRHGSMAAEIRHYTRQSPGAGPMTLYNLVLPISRFGKDFAFTTVVTVLTLSVATS